MESSSYRELRGILKKKYNISAVSIEKIKGVYRILTSERIYCLKPSEYTLPHFLFILGAIKHLRSNGFEYGPAIITTVDGEDYIEYGGEYAYLMPWLKGRECSYDNLIELYMAAVRLGELHNASEGFNVTSDMKPRVGWFKWIEVFRTRMNEILDFKYKILDKEKKSEVDILYLNQIPYEIERCQRAIERLVDSDYDTRMLQQIRRSGFCHHDYAHHNVMVCDNGINIIDFDYCIMDTYLHDLASLLIRSMKYGRWDMERASLILRAYNAVHKLDADDIEIMTAFMEFPQDFWQRGIQYYWEKQPWGDDFFRRKLQLYKDDINEKEAFIKTFRKSDFNKIIGGNL